MATDFKSKYPNTNADTIALAITIAGLQTDTNLLIGRESDAIVNTVNLDIDHWISGKIRLGGATPTAAKRIELWVHAPIKVASGVPTYGDVLTGADGLRTLTAANVKNSLLRQVWATDTDAAVGRDYFIPPTGIKQFFADIMPTHWGVFLVHNTGVALDSTAGNHYLHYGRGQVTGV